MSAMRLVAALVVGLGTFGAMCACVGGVFRSLEGIVDAQRPRDVGGYVACGVLCMVAMAAVFAGGVYVGALLLGVE